MEFANDVSIVIPIYKGENWINGCFLGIKNQNLVDNLKLEICIADDGSTDGTPTLLQEWSGLFKKSNISFTVFTNFTRERRGVGYAKNRAVHCSKGKYLCSQDVDDIMLPNRIRKQYDAAVHLPTNTLQDIA